ncbi:MAG: serine protease [Cyanobacteria bacterium]|nr:serine protease [Cyanobacteriota bacterium]
MASQTIRCGIGIDYSGFGTKALLRCVDVVGREFVTATGKGVAISESGELKAAIRDLAKTIQTMRPRFDASQTVDILARLPTVETHSLTERSLDEIAQAGRPLSPIEGLWITTDETGYRLGIVSVDAGREFAVVTLDSPRSYVWQPGMVKARLTSAADGQTFAAKWRLGDRSEVSGIATLKGSALAVSFRREGKEETIHLLKLRPSVATSASASNSDPIAASSGTGFLCAPGIVATNHHVVDGAKSVELYLPVQKRSFKLQLLLSDAANDLALLRVMEDAASLPPPLALADSSELKLGADAFVVGFPLGDALGSGHKVTSGLVSALDGLKGDPRELQLTAPIQPGSSGSPVFDNTSRVIGVVTSTLDSLAAMRAAGQLPQNVNFAIKADYLSLLLKRIPDASMPTVGVKAPVALQLTDLVDRVRVSVGQIRASR